MGLDGPLNAPLLRAWVSGLSSLFGASTRSVLAGTLGTTLSSSSVSPLTSLSHVLSSGAKMMAEQITWFSLQNRILRILDQHFIGLQSSSILALSSLVSHSQIVRPSPRNIPKTKCVHFQDAFKMLPLFRAVSHSCDVWRVLGQFSLKLYWWYSEGILCWRPWN